MAAAAGGGQGGAQKADQLVQHGLRPRRVHALDAVGQLEQQIRGVERRIRTRTETLARQFERVLIVVEGIYTAIPLHQKILNHPDFVAGRIDTGFLMRSGLLPEKK